VSPARGSHEPEYDADLEALSLELQFEVTLVEEHILADPDRTYQRDHGPDGAIYDFSAYDRLGVTIVYERDGYDFTFLRLSDRRGTL
jgi:hypothetical protein